MRGSFRIARVFGIPVSLHITFLLFVAFLAMVYAFKGGLAEAVRGVSFILALFLSVTLHELGHSLVARRFGVKVREIVLLPIGGVSQMESMPEQPRQEFLIAVAGPLTSVVLGLLLGAFSLLAYGPAETLRASVTGGRFIANLGRVNLLLAVFNLLPGFPMDGGRILRSILATYMPFPRATRIAAVTGRLFAVCLGVIGLFGNVWLAFIAVFIYLGAGQEESGVRMRAALHDIPVSRAMVREFQELSPDDPISRAVEFAYHGFQEDFPVTKDGEVVGVLTKADTLAALHRYGPQVAVSQIMRTDFTRVKTDQTLEQVYQAVRQCGCSSLPVVEGNRLVGIITLEALGRYFMFSSAASDRR